MKFFIPLVLAIGLTSCAVHTGMITATPTHGQDKNIEYVDVAVGYSRVFYLFNIGGLGKDAITNEAKRNLFLSYPLKNGQAFENLTLDFKTFRFGPFVKRKAIVVADVVQRDSSVKIRYSSTYQKFISEYSAIEKNGFSLNENVYYCRGGKVFPSKVIKINNKRILVFFMQRDATLKVKSVPYRKVCKLKESIALETATGFKIGEKVLFKDALTASDIGAHGGKIVALNTNGAVIKTQNKLVFVAFKEIKKDEQKE